MNGIQGQPGAIVIGLILFVAALVFQNWHTKRVVVLFAIIFTALGVVTLAAAALPETAANILVATSVVIMIVGYFAFSRRFMRAAVRNGSLDADKYRRAVLKVPALSVMFFLMYLVGFHVLHLESAEDYWTVALAVVVFSAWDFLSLRGLTSSSDADPSETA